MTGWAGRERETKNFRASRPLGPLATPAIVLGSAALLLSGCNSTKISQAGDARVRTTERFRGFDLFVEPSRIVEIELPRVDLSQAGDHRFRVRGARSPTVPTELSIRYPFLPPRSDDYYSRQWGNARLRLSFADIQGRVLYDQPIDLTTQEFRSNGPNQAHTEFTWSIEFQGHRKDLIHRLRELGEYDVHITVEAPVSKKGHFVSLRGRDLYYGKVMMTDPVPFGQ